MTRRKKNRDVKTEESVGNPQSGGDAFNAVQDFRHYPASVSVPAPDPFSKRPRYESSPVAHQTYNATGLQREPVFSRQIVSSNAPQPQTPNVKPLRLGQHVYTPISMARAGRERVSIFGIVLRDVEPAYQTSTGDFKSKVYLADASCIDGTGSAKKITRSLTIVIFQRSESFIPNGVKTGQIMALREIEIQEFNLEPQGVAKNYNTKWSWTVFDPVTGTVKNTPNVVLGPKGVPDEEMQHYRDMAKEWVDISAADTEAKTAALPTSRATITLDQMAVDKFYDIVVVVVKVYHGTRSTLFVTDYTRNKGFHRYEDPALGLGTLSYPEENNAYGYVLQISLWDGAVKAAEGLVPGDTVRIRNVRGKHNQYGMLEGAVGSASDLGNKMYLLQKDNPAYIALQERKAKLAGNIFDSSKATATRPVGGQSDPNQGQSQQHNSVSRLTEVASSPSSTEQSVQRPTSPAAAVKTENAVPSSVQNSVGPSFPTPAQRVLQTVQLTVATSSIDEEKKTTQSLVEDKLWLPRPGVARTVETPQPLICCNAPSAVAITSLLDLQTTASCPDAHKVTGRILSTEPVKVKDWARLECRVCNRLVPRHERFCTKCGDEDGNSLTHCLRFSVILQETEKEKHSRLESAEESANSQSEVATLTIAILFHGKSSEKLLPFADVKRVFNGELAPIKQLKKFRDQMLFPNLYNRQTETTFSVHAYPVVKCGKIVREFAAFKQDHILHDSFDPNVK